MDNSCNSWCAANKLHWQRGQCSVPGKEISMKVFSFGTPGRSLLRFSVALTLLTGGVMAQAQTRLFSWGYNGGGNLGDGSTASRNVPGSVKAPPGSSALGGVASVAAGLYHTVAVRTDGTVYAWGQNNYGQLGNDTTTDSLKPVQVKGPSGAGVLTGVQQIAANQYTSLVLKTDGTVWGWGYNGYGHLGDNTTTSRDTPVQVHGPNDVGFLTN